MFGSPLGSPSLQIAERTWSSCPCWYTLYKASSDIPDSTKNHLKWFPEAGRCNTDDVRVHNYRKWVTTERCVCNGRSIVKGAFPAAVHGNHKKGSKYFRRGNAGNTLCHRWWNSSGLCQWVRIYKVVNVKMGGSYSALLLETALLPSSPLVLDVGFLARSLARSASKIFFFRRLIAALLYSIFAPGTLFSFSYFWILNRRHFYSSLAPSSPTMRSSFQQFLLMLWQ